MPPRKPHAAYDPTEEAIRRAGSIGALELPAGIEPAPAVREAFWRPFAHLPGAEGLDAGVAELKRRIRVAGVAETSPSRRRVRNHA